eukprot:scaffold80182_cov60-Phaeocystis_antarctica.AAC.4
MAISERMSERSEPLALYGGMLKVAPWQCPSSAPAPPQGAPGGSGQLGTPRAWPSHWDLSHRLEYEQMSGLGSARRLPGLATPAVLQYRHLTLTLTLILTIT